MADTGKLWFEMGVRENVTETMKKIIEAGVLVGNTLDEATKKVEKGFDAQMKNAAKLEQVYASIGRAMERVKTAMGSTSDAGERQRLQALLTQLQQMKRAFEEVERSEERMGTSGSVAAEMLRQNFSLAMRQVNEYTRAVQSSATSEERRVNTLRNRYNELARVRERLRAAIVNAPSGQDTSGAMAYLNKLFSQQMQVAKALKNGTQMSFGADYKELIRGANEAAKSIEKVTAASEREARALDNSAKREAVAAARQLAQVNEGLVKSYDAVTAAGQRQSRMLRELGTMASYYFSLWGAVRFLSDTIQRGGQFEVQHVALQNIIGDLGEANRLFEQLKGLAIESPMTFGQLTKYMKQLAAFSIPSNELFDTTRRLADLSTGLGVDMGRLILAYGQVRSAAVLRGQELRQFTEAGIPLVQRLADKFTELNGTVTRTGDVFELISKRKVSFEMVRDVLWDMTNEGGQFFDMQYRIAETLSGKWQKLSDAYEQFLGKLANGQTLSGKVLKGMLDLLVGLVRNAEKLLPLAGGIMSAFALKGMYSAGQKLFTANAASVYANIRAAQQMNALEIEREHTLGRITAERRLELLEQNNSISRSVITLANANRLSVVELAGLYRKKAITAEDVQQLVLEKAITEEEAKQVLSANALSIAKMRVGASLKGMMTASMGWTVAISGLIYALMSWRQHVSEVEEAHRALREEMERSAQERVRSSQQILNMPQASTSAEYTERIEAMSKYLEENAVGLQKVATESQHTGTDLESLRARYEELKEAIDAVNEANKKLAENPGWFDEADDRSGRNWWIGGNQEFSGRLKKMTADYNAFKRGFSDIFASDVTKTKDVLDSLRKKYQDFGKAVEDAGVANDFSKQADILMRYNDAFIDFYRQMYNGNSATRQAARDMGEAWTDYNKHLAEAKEKSVDFANVIKARMQETWRDIDFNNLTPAQSEALSSGFDDWRKAQQFEASVMLQDLQAMMSANGLVIPVRVEKEGAEDELRGWKKELDDMLKNRYTTEIKAISNISDVAEFVQKKHKELKEQIEGAKPIAISFGIKFDAASSKFTGLATMPWNPGVEAAAQANDLLDADKLLQELAKKWGLDINGGKSGSSSGSKKDEALARAKNRLAEVKKIYAEYKKYREVYGDKEGLRLVEELFGMKPGEGESIVGNYRKTLNNILSSLSLTTEERKKFGIDVKGVMGDMDLDAAKKAIEKQVSELKEWISRRGEQFNLFKSILEKTGDEALASNAFKDGQIWTEYAREMEAKLSEVMGGASVDWAMTDEAAKEFFGRNKEAYELWKKIVEVTRKEYVQALNDAASATEKLLTTEEKIAKVESEITRLRSNGAGENDTRVLAKEQELRNLRAKALEESTQYLTFYSAILSMTTEEAELAGDAIRENLVRQLADGTINADKYLKSIKNIDAQLAKSRSARGALAAFASGGVSGVLSERRSRTDEGEYAAVALKIQQTEEALIQARKQLGMATAAGNEQEAEMYRARIRQLMLQKEETQREQERIEAARKLLRVDEDAVTSMNNFLAVAELAIGAVEGIADALDDISETFDALGNETAANLTSDIADGMRAALSPFNSAMGAMKSLLKGDIGGAFSGLVGVFTSPIKGFAQLHDKRREREIQQSVAQVNALERAYKNLEKAIETVLGGIYTSGGYEDMFDNLKKQRDELQKQLDLERDKKKSDKSKMEDYEQQIQEADESIRNFARDMAKALYDIDIKNWASGLGDALFEAWKKGENGAEAFKKKAKDIIGELTKNIVAQKIIETALAPVLKIVEDEMMSKEGKLDESSVVRIATALGALAGPLSESVYKVYDAVDAATSDLGGWKEAAETASSGATAIKSITEDQTNLLLSYINAMRADLSIHTERFRVFLENLMPGLNNQFANQLAELKSIEENTRRSADNADKIYNFLNGAALGQYKLGVKVYA